MRVYVTQGHERGIGLEVFFKASLLATSSDLKRIQLLAFQDSARETLEALKLPYHIESDHLKVAGQRIEVQWLQTMEFSQSLTSLRRGMELAEKGGVLFTLPTSKDQFPGFPGHTEYFRSHYRTQDLGMFFSSPDLQVLLLSDHVPVNALSKSLETELILSRLRLALQTLEHWRWPIKQLIVSGFNPHAGEGGLIGTEDSRISDALEALRKTFQMPMSGPFPGDTMLFERQSPEDLLVYVFHDQGLGVFKGLQGFVGANITLGLPYPRVSPDHGTSFKLYGKNASDYRGCAFSLREALKLLQRIDHGKNSSHKGKGP